jgi:hypothetical protein
MVNTMANTLANTLADKNRGLSPVYGNLMASFCQTSLARDHLRHFSKHVGRQKPVYFPPLWQTKWHLYRPHQIAHVSYPRGIPLVA